MLMPKRVKRRRQMRGRMKGKANKGNIVAYGEYGLVSTEPGWITSNQIEEIGRASVGKECVRRCRSRWSPYH